MLKLQIAFGVALLSLSAVACGGSDKPATDPSAEGASAPAAPADPTRAADPNGNTDSSRNGTSTGASEGSTPPDAPATK